MLESLSAISDAAESRCSEQAGERRTWAPTPTEIVERLCHDFDLLPADVLGPRRHARLTAVRHAAMWLMRRFCGASYPEIGRYFGRDRTSVIAAVRALDRHRASLIAGVPLRMTPRKPARATLRRSANGDAFVFVKPLRHPNGDAFFPRAPEGGYELTEVEA